MFVKWDWCSFAKPCCRPTLKKKKLVKCIIN